MAKFVTVTKTITVTDGGETVVDQEWGLSDLGVDDYLRSSATISSGSDVTLCIRGTNVVGITDPLVLPLSKIRGYVVESDVALQVKENAAAVAVQAGPGSFGKDTCALDTIELANSSGLLGTVRFIVWGDK